MPDSTAGLLILGLSVEAKRRQESYLFNHDISEARGWESTCLTCATPCIRLKHCTTIIIMMMMMMMIRRNMGREKGEGELIYIA